MGNDYDMCNLLVIIIIFGFGVDVVILDRLGWYYYVCVVLGYCVIRYLKVKIYVNVSDVGFVSILSSVGVFGGGFNLSVIVGVIIGIVVVMFVVVGVVWYNRWCKRFFSLYGSCRSGLIVWKFFLIFFESFGVDGFRVFMFKELVVVMKNFFWMELFG